jgi:hypothetical protein
MVFLARICKKKNMLAPEKKGLAPELFLVLSIPAEDYMGLWHCVYFDTLFTSPIN